MSRKWLGIGLLLIIVAAFVLQRFDFGTIENQRYRTEIAALRAELGTLREEKASPERMKEFAGGATESLNAIIERLDTQAKKHPVDRRLQFEWELRAARERVALQAVAVALKRMIENPENINLEQDKEYFQLMQGVDRIRNDKYTIVPTSQEQRLRARQLDSSIHPMTIALTTVLALLGLVVGYRLLRRSRLIVDASSSPAGE